MILSPEATKQIVQRKRTMIRLPVRGRDCPVREGKAYAVQPGVGHEAVARVTVMETRQEWLPDVSLKDARREGFTTTTELLDAWREHHGPVDVYVWVVGFAVGDLEDRPRLLAARPGGPGGDYTSQPHLAVRDEGEAVSAAEQDRFSRAGRERDAKRTREPDALLRDGLVRELEAWRQASGGVTDQDRYQAIRGIERQIRTLERKLRAA